MSSSCKWEQNCEKEAVAKAVLYGRIIIVSRIGMSSIGSRIVRQRQELKL
jgi:hypothetical protein